MKLKLFIAKIIFCFQTILYVIKTWVLKQKHNNLVFYVLTPEHENIGDQALAYAGTKIIKDAGLYPFEITGDLLSRFVNYPVLLKIMFYNSTIICQAGGYLGTLWFDYSEAYLRKMMQAVPDNKIVVLPQTMYYSDDEFGRTELKNSKKIYSACKNLTLFAREKITYENMKKYYPSAKIYLIPDIVLYLGEYKFLCERKGVMMTLRDDVEKTLSNKKIKEVENLINSKFDDVRYVDMISDHRINAKQRSHELKLHFQHFCSSEIVVTDRLHGMIFSAVTGTPCIVLNSKSPKVKGIYDWIFSNCEYIIFTENIEEMNDFIDRCKGKMYTFDNSYLSEYFDELKILLNK